MNPPQAPKERGAPAFGSSSPLAALGERVRSPLDGNEASRAVGVLAVQVPFLVALASRAAYLEAHPEIDPFYDRAALGPLSRALHASTLLTLGLAAWGLWLRRRRRSSRGSRASGGRGPGSRAGAAREDPARPFP